jgi:hypothetical protein
MTSRNTPNYIPIQYKTMPSNCNIYPQAYTKMANGNLRVIAGDNRSNNIESLVMTSQALNEWVKSIQSIQSENYTNTCLNCATMPYMKMGHTWGVQPAYTL